MIALLLSVTFGAGVYLLYEGLTNPRQPAVPRRARTSVDEFLLRAGLPDVTPREFVLFSVCAALVTGLVAHLLLGWVIVSALAALLGLVGPLAYYVQRHERQRAVLQNGLAEAIAQLRDAIRTGLSIQDALVGLARTGPEALRPEFAILAREMRMVGGEAALTNMRDRLADPLFDVVAATLILNDQLGGRNVSQVLDRLAHATRAQLKVQEELRAYQAQTVMSARVIAAMPLVVLIAIRQVNPRYLAVFNDWSGQLLLALCLVSVVIGYASMLWLTRLPGERRILR